MIPRPHDALPLPPRPSLDRYRKLAKDLVKACQADQTGDPAALRRWAEYWVGALERLSGLVIPAGMPADVEGWINGVEAFARSRMADAGRACALADAQFVLARSHGFQSWPAFVAHLRELERAASPAARFEAAVNAIAGGDLEGLKRLLAGEPALAQARSPREHGATLLHYTAANGVEGYRQRTPANIVPIARALLEAGANVNAEADIYGGGATTLGLAATSVHPERAGVQLALLRLLLEHGASMRGGRHSLVAACLGNGRGAAAAFLADAGAPLGLAEAAGVGRMDALRSFFAGDDSLIPGASREEVQQGFLHACQYGRDEAIMFLLERGAEIDLPGGFGGQTGLHWAIVGGQVETVKLLLARGAPLEAVNGYGGTPAGQALWSAEHGGDPERYRAILAALATADARPPM